MTEFKVGLLTLVACASMMIVALKITANKPGIGSYVTYRAVIPDATGIYSRTPIKVAGINAGYIKSIELRGSNAVVAFEVLDKVHLTENSILRIKTIGFLGEKYLDIYIGDPNGNKLGEGDYIKVYSGGGIEDLAKDASEILLDVKEIVRKVKQSLKSDDSDNVIKDIVANVKSITQNVDRLIADNDEKLDRIVANVERISDQIAYETDRTEPNSFMQDLTKVGPILDDVKASAADLRVMIADVKAGKGTIGKLLRDEETVDKVNEALSGVNRLMNRINNIEATIAIHNGYNNEHGAHTQFDIDIKPSPERFFRLGVIKNDFGPVVSDETQTTTTTDGVTSYQEREEVDKGAFKFNLQIGRIFPRWAIRLGIIESEGGFGVDYLLNDYGMRFGLEAFDFEKDEGANIRLISEFDIWNVFYGRIALEDVITNDRSYTVSAGLRFTDEDLAALIGMMAN